jgi:hypothetical protein
MKIALIGMLCGSMVGITAGIASAEDEDCGACQTSCSTARDECLQDAQTDEIGRSSCMTTYAKCRKNCRVNLLCKD